jgi:hypothetical protein
VRTRLSRLAGTIGLAIGLVVIGGSVVGGIALANDRSHEPTTGVSTDASQATTDEDQDGDADDATEDKQGNDAIGHEADADADDADDADDANDAGSPADEATPHPSPSGSHDDDGPGDD